MSKVMWVSQYPPLPRQIERLQRMFGADVEVEHLVPPHGDQARKVAEEFRRSGAVDLVAVVPLAAISRFCEEGLRPLWAEMVPTEQAKAEVSVKGRHLRFDRFRRITGVRLEFAQKTGARVPMVCKLLWLSRHDPGEQRLERLREMFGADVVVKQDRRSFTSGEEIERYFRDSGSDDLVVPAAPYSILDQLCQKRLNPLWPEMVETDDPSQAVDTTPDGRHLRFDRFRRITGVRMEFEEVE